MEERYNVISTHVLESQCFTCLQAKYLHNIVGFTKGRDMAPDSWRLETYVFGFCHPILGLQKKNIASYSL